MTRTFTRLRSRDGTGCNKGLPGLPYPTYFEQSICPFEKHIHQHFQIFFRKRVFWYKFLNNPQYYINLANPYTPTPFAFSVPAVHAFIDYSVLNIFLPHLMLWKVLIIGCSSVDRVWPNHCCTRLTAPPIKSIFKNNAQNGLKTETYNIKDDIYWLIHVTM